MLYYYDINNYWHDYFRNRIPTVLILKKKYNLELKLKYWGFLEINLKCVISDDGNTIHTFGIWSDLEYYKWQSEDDLKHLAEDRDPALEPTCHYKIQPENQGKLVWLTGTPGSGKSTVGHLMSKEAGYVYLEGDCVENYLNPFISPDLSENDATKNAFRQKPLKVHFSKQAICLNLIPK